MNNILKVDNNLCTGCGACYNGCPVDAISMEYNNEGFLRPVINNNCINCGKCTKVCPVINPVEVSTSTECYAVWADEETRMKSSSGGFFSVLARYVFENNGIVCGAAFEDGYYSVSHKWASTEEELASLRGSKYVQSSTGLTYSETKKYLDEGKMVLYSGCPCQIAGIKKYLGKEYDNLLTVDIVCHGVPSPKVYESYLNDKSKGIKVSKMNFREKEYWGWGSAISLFMENGDVYRNDCFKDPYFRGFLGGVITRNSCGTCKYSSMNRVGDFTIGDFWGVKDIDASCDDKKGTGLVLVNNLKAKQILNKVKNKCELIKKIDKAAVMEGAKTRNGRLLHSTKQHIFRNRFFNEFEKNKNGEFSSMFEKTTKKYDVGYVGWWDSRNYGSALTSFAMNRTLKNMGKSVLMLQHPGMSPGPNTDSSYGVQFARHFCDCSEITTDKNFKKFNNLCDTFVVGSDQLWNWYNNKHFGTGYFFLDFVDNTHKKIAYATSFGSDWAYYPDNLRLKVGYLMSRFDHISVREKSGVTICKNDFGVEATHVLDPVFLCDIDSYKEVIALSKIECKEKYIFSYILDPTVDKIKMVKKVAEHHGLPYKIAIDALRDNDNESKCVIDELLANDPNLITNLRIEDWLYYIYNAEFVATDSFHGFCYSIIFNKPMIAYINKRRGIARFESIAKLTGLESRLVEAFSDNECNRILNDKVDFEAVNSKLDEARKFSLDWLKNALDSRKSDTSVQEMMLWKIIEHDRMLYGNNMNSYEEEIKKLKERLNELENRNIITKIRKIYSKTKVIVKKTIAYYKKFGFKATARKIVEKLK